MSSGVIGRQIPDVWSGACELAIRLVTTICAVVRASDLLQVGWNVQRGVWRMCLPCGMQRTSCSRCGSQVLFP